MGVVACAQELVGLVAENDDMEKEPASKVNKSSQERKSRLPAPASQPSQ